MICSVNKLADSFCSY